MATHYNTLLSECVQLYTQNNTMQYTAIHSNIVQHTTILCNTTDGGNRSENNYDCQIFKQVFMGVPVHFKQVLTAVNGVPVTQKIDREN